jgi:hypothetical protein
MVSAHELIGVRGNNGGLVCCSKRTRERQGKIEATGGVVALLRDVVT